MSKFYADLGNGILIDCTVDTDCGPNGHFPLILVFNEVKYLRSDGDSYLKGENMYVRYAAPTKH